VHTGRGSDDFGDLLVVEFSKAVREWSGRVDQTLEKRKQREQMCVRPEM
jgi:hypothetical protein